MADENAEQVTPPEEVVSEVVATTGFLATIKKEVAALVTKDSIHTQFITGLVTDKVMVRAATLKKAFETLSKLGSELNKIRPKSPGFDENEVELPKTFTGDDVKKRKELKEKTTKIEKAVDRVLGAKAVDKDWSDLDEILAKAG